MIIVYSNLAAYHAYILENDEQIRALKQHCSDIKISMSTHSSHAIQYAEDLNLDFVLYGHVFETKSKKGLTLDHLVRSMKH